MLENNFELIIIGGGPAGWTAAIYAARSGRSVAVIEKGAPGGKLINISTVHNYPGSPDIKGGDMAMNLFSQATSFGTKFISSEVTELTKEGQDFKVVTTSEVYTSKSIIISTGLVNRKLNVPGEDEYYFKGLSYCVVCDGPLVKGKDIALVGGGNSSVQESAYGATVANKLYILQNLDKLTAEQAVIDNMKKADNIEVIYNATVKEVVGDGNNVNGIIYLDKDGNEQKLDVQGVFPYVGFIPKTEFIKIDGVVNKDGYIKTGESMETSVPGLYAAGDVRDKHVRQITTATSDGTIASISANSYLQGIK